MYICSIIFFLLMLITRGCPEHRVAEFLNQLCENLPAKESSPEKEQQKDGKETKPVSSRRHYYCVFYSKVLHTCTYV